MFETLLVGGILSLLISLIAAMIVLKIQRTHQERIQSLQQAWERAFDIRQQQWQAQQEKLFRDFEQKVLAQTQQIRSEWQEWEAKDAERVENLKREYETTATRAHIERELARLPRVEDTPLTLNPDQHLTTRWQPPRLQNADLSHRDLSSRYLGYADLRGAQLSHANLFMADLFRAWLAGADLSEADLSGSNLTEADLRGANLANANFLVADLNNAVLIGADLRQARNLTLEQLDCAIFDNTTRLEEGIAQMLSSHMHARRLSSARSVRSVQKDVEAAASNSVVSRETVDASEPFDISSQGQPSVVSSDKQQDAAN